MNSDPGWSPAGRAAVMKCTVFETVSGKTSWSSFSDDRILFWNTQLISKTFFLSSELSRSIKRRKIIKKQSKIKRRVTAHS